MKVAAPNMRLAPLEDPSIWRANLKSRRGAPEQAPNRKGGAVWLGVAEALAFLTENPTAPIPPSGTLKAQVIAGGQAEQGTLLRRLSTKAELQACESRSESQSEPVQTG